MKKNLSRIFILLILTPLFLTSVSHSAFSQPIIHNQSNNGNLIIYVNATLAPGIYTELQQYKTDIEAEGYSVKIIHWTDLHHDPIQRVINLKNNITQEYTTNGLNGTVLVGEMPFALYEHTPVDYICDLYLMDLDGSWTNTDVDSDFDTHTNGTGDMYPEIFVGRINPKPVNSTHEVQLLISYFQRNHDYRTGITPKYNNSLMFIDDDWESTSHEWKSDMKFLYDNITLINNTVMTTNSTNYLQEIRKPYDFGHIFIHSDPEAHYFKNGTHFGIDGSVHSLQLKISNISMKFFMLYCCYAARFDMPDNLATQYLFAPKANNSLAVFGSSTSGGFLLNQYLYEPLGEGWTLGESFKNWWFNDILDPVIKTHGPTDSAVRGNILLGDPTLRIRNPPSEPNPKLTPLQITLFIVGPIVMVGAIALGIVIVKNRKTKKQS